MTVKSTWKSSKAFENFGKLALANLSTLSNLLFQTKLCYEASLDMFFYYVVNTTILLLFFSLTTFSCQLKQFLEA